MRSILYCRNPQSLEESINILYEANYAYYNPYQNKPQQNNQNYEVGRNRNERKNNFQPRRNEQTQHNNNNSSTQHNNNNSVAQHRNFRPNRNENSQQRTIQNSHNYNPHSNNNNSRQQHPKNYNFYPNNNNNYRPQNSNNYNSHFTNNNNPRNNNFRNQFSPNSYSNINQKPPKSLSNPQPSTSRLPPPEPMEINTNENLYTNQTNNDQQNFQLPASPADYHIS